MLFDLRGRRKRAIQVIYAVLALLFAVSFVGFGIGSDAAGGIFDALGFGDGSRGGNPQFEQQVEDAEKKLAQDPKNENALEELVRVQYTAGNDALELDEETEAVRMTPEAEQSFRAATDAWERYVKVADDPDEGTAAIAGQAYGALLQFSRDPLEIPALAEEAVTAAEVSAEENPSVGTYATLAQYAYFAGDNETAERAGERALEEAPPSQRQQVEEQLDAVERVSRRLHRDIDRQAEQETPGEPFANPFQDLGGGQPTAPAPLAP